MGSKRNTADVRLVDEAGAGIIPGPMSPSLPLAARERAAVSALFFLNGFGFANWAARIPQLQQDLAIGDAALGIALLALAAGSLVSMPLVGGLVARIGSAATARAFAIAFSVSLALPAIAPTYALLIAGAAVFGACNGALDVAMNAQASANEKRIGRPIMASFHGLYSLGGLAGAATGGGAATLGWSPSMHIGALAALITLVMAWASWHLPAQHDERGRAGPLVTLPTRDLLVYAAIGFCVLVGESAMADWSAVYLTRIAGTPAGEAALGFAAFSVTMAAGRFAGDRIIHRVGQVAVVRWGGAIAALGTALAVTTSTAAIAITGFALVGAGLSCIFPCLMTAASRSTSMPPGPAIAAVATFGYTGFLLGPPMIGFVSEATNLRFGLGTVVVLCAVVALLAGRVGGVRT